MNRHAPRHLKHQPSLMARTVPVGTVRGTALATGAVLTVPAGAAGMALAGSADAATTAAPAVKASAAVPTRVAVKTAPTSTVVVLRYGSKGELVKTLQKRLGISVDGSFGPATLAAVKSYQGSKGLVRDGYVGPATWAKLGGFPSTSSGSDTGSGSSGGTNNCSVNVVRYGASGSLVKTLQQRLSISVDGSFGPATLAAVKSYQGSKGLVRDGIVGPATWRALGGFPCGTGGSTGGGDTGGGTTTTPVSPGSPYKLPFPAGVSHRITQSPSGLFSHSDRYSKYAIDFAMPSGSTVLVSRSGTVYKAGWDPYGGGNSVMVRDASGSCMQYNHLSSISVRAGQSVSQGQLVGRSGNTGNSTGPHLHFGLVQCSSYVSTNVPSTVERGTSYPVGVYATSQNG
ncbi:peptidoglycan DD-metalloendopeptidase family protein [Dermacoccaceae bacterium W4C1]